MFLTFLKNYIMVYSAFFLTWIIMLGYLYLTDFKWDLWPTDAFLFLMLLFTIASIPIVVIYYIIFFIFWRSVHLDLKIQFLWIFLLSLLWVVSNEGVWELVSSFFPKKIQNWIEYESSIDFYAPIIFGFILSLIFYILAFLSRKKI